MSQKSLRITIAALILMASVGMLIAILQANSDDVDLNELLSGGCNYYSAPTIATQDITADDGLIQDIFIGGEEKENTDTTTAVTEQQSETAPNQPSETTPTETSAATESTTEATTTTAAMTTTTEPQGDPEPSTIIITNEKCNIRSDAGAKNEFMGEAKQGEVYEVIDSKKSDTDVLWYQVKLKDGRTGYICASFCAFRHGKLPGAKAYLTFDDGPTENTPKILKILDEYNVKATFFVIYHSGQEKTYKSIVEKGHTLALHSYSHDYEKIYSSREAYFKDLDKLSAYLEKTTGQTPKLMRFPGGSSNTISRKYCKGIMTDLTAEVTNRGYKYFDWNLDSGDASAYRVKKSKIVNNVMSQIGNGGSQVILMHDAAAKTTTVEALPEIIEALQSYGYEILPLDESSPETHQQVAN